MTLDKFSVYADAIRELWDSFPKLAINLTTAILIYVFGYKVFPSISQNLGLSVGSVGAHRVIIFLTIVATLYFIYKCFREIKDIADAFAQLLAVNIGDDVTKQEIADYKTAIRGFLYTVALAAVSYFYMQMISAAFGTTVAGIILVGVVFISIVMLFRSVKALETEIAAWSKEQAEKTEKMLRETAEE